MAVTIVKIATFRPSVRAAAVAAAATAAAVDNKILAQATGSVWVARPTTLRPAMLVSSAMSPVLTEAAATVVAVTVRFAKENPGCVSV